MSRRLAEHLAAAAASLGLATLFALPVLGTFAGRLWGDSGDSWQNLWNGWWMGRALLDGTSPFHTDLLWHPDGVSLWLHTLGPLNAALTAAGLAVLPGFAGYNLLILLHLAFGVYGGFVLSRHLLRRAAEAGRLPGPASAGAAWAAALAGGVAFGLSPYTWAHVSVHLHLMGLGWVALFTHALFRAWEAPGRRWPLLAALWAGLTALSGWYLLLDEALIGTAVLLAAAGTARRDGAGGLRRVAAAGLAAAVVCLPVALPTWLAQQQPLEGTHDPRIFSADLLSLVVPAPVQALGAPFLELTRRFTGNSGENGGYLGYVALALAGLALVRVGGRHLRVLAGIGAAGLLLSLGPRLHLAGRILDVPLPYAAAARALPFLDGMGTPVRFGLLVNLALGAGVAVGAAWLAGRLRPRWAWVVPAACGCLVAAEYAPAGQRTHRYPDPAWLAALAEVPGDFAVADLTGWTHPLYNQMLHGRPIVHGYTSRRPVALVDGLFSDPVLGPIYGEVHRGRAPARLALTRVDARLDFDWGPGAPDPAVQPDFEAKWTGTLEVTAGGPHRFVLGSDDGASLWIDGRRVVDNEGVHAYREASGVVDLAPGRHPVRVTFADRGGLARLVWRWRPPGAEAESVVPPQVLRAPSGAPGLLGRYRHRAALPRLDAAAARRHLRDVWGVRYFVAYEDRTPFAVRARLGLIERARSDGLVLYEVPWDAPPPSGPAALTAPGPDDD